MPLVSGVCRTASAPKPSHGGSRLNASKPEANPKTRCPLYIYIYYIYTKSRLALHTPRSCVVAESNRHMHRVSGKVYRLSGFATVRIRLDQPRLCARTCTHAPRVCLCVCVCAQVFAYFLYRFIFIESPPNSLELALSKAPSIFIITRQTR